MDQNVEVEKDRRASSKDPSATTELLSAASAVGGEESDAMRGGGGDVGVPSTASPPADDASLPACAAGADGGVELRADALLEKAEAALARLYDTHDSFFSSDKDEKEVRRTFWR